MAKTYDVHGVNYDMHQHFNNMFYLETIHCKQPDRSLIYEFLRKKTRLWFLWKFTKSVKVVKTTFCTKYP